LIPSFEALNPYAKASRSGEKRWLPVPNLYHSKESLALRAAVGKVLKKVHEQISPAELEMRANTPEFKVSENDWVAHKENNQLALITPLKTVARLPASLIISPQLNQHKIDGNVFSIDMSGYLRKRGETNKSFKRRYMELGGSVLTYYKKKPEKNGILLSRDDKKAYERGSIDLDRVSSLKPTEDTKSEPFCIHLVTTSRTWVLSAESEADYMDWLKALCNVVKFSAIHITFKRMFQLQEVSATAVTDVRMVIATGDTVGEIVEHIFNCYKQALDAAPLRSYDPSKYLIKVTGYRDFMIDRFRCMNEYMHVRECLLTKKTIRLTLIHESVIQETAMRSLAIRTDLSVAKSAIPAQLADCWGVERLSTLHMTTLGDDWSRSSMLHENNTIGSGSLREPLSLCIRRVLNIPRCTCIRKRSSEEARIEYIPLTSSSVLIRGELYDGGSLLHGAMFETKDVHLKAQKDDLLYVEWTEQVWFNFDVNICDLPRSSRLVLTLYGVKRVIGSNQKEMVEAPSNEKILTTGINIFEVDGLLVQRTKYVQMYNNLVDCRQGPVPHIVHTDRPFIQADFSTFGSPVKFDWSTVATSIVIGTNRMGDHFARRTAIQSRQDMLRKEGWLHKIGFSKWTRWRRRWFILDQSSCSLSYSDDEHAPRKNIPLKNCYVGLADDMNEKYTTCPVNKGTRKERQTYCFKVRPKNSSRDYIISAETKQEREEWMVAIHTVSKYGEGQQFENNQENSSRSDVECTPEEEDNNAAEACGKNDAYRRQSSSDSSSSSTISLNALSELRRVIMMDPLYRLSPYQKQQMWNNRREFMDIPAALPRILSCVHWDDKAECKEALRLVPKWAIPDHPAAYIELLDGKFSNEGIRQFAVDQIGKMPDLTLSYFLPQLVQAIKFENHHVSSLALHLIERAIRNPNQIGFDLFWSMKVESYNPQYRERYGILLNTYLDVCSQKMREILKLQDKLFAADGMFERICVNVKNKKKEGSEEMKRVLYEGLEALNEMLPSTFQLPIDPRIEVGKIIVKKCRVMDSAKKPLWLVFENAEEGGNPVTVIFKAGDDVRQDCLTLQLIRLMDEMWRDEGLDLAMEPYKCVATSPMTGILQVVPNSVTTADVHKRVGILGAFKDPSFSEWISANNPDRKSHKAAIDLFRRSCAGYCVATCILGIGDRHNDNIMVSYGWLLLLTFCVCVHLINDILVSRSAQRGGTFTLILDTFLVTLNIR
jgi:phosphatidylinositol-4,5-bisphosphate 3-kinase